MAGKPIEETKREMGLREVIKLASNENPLGPSPKALSALKKCLRDLNRYPDSAGLSLKKRLAKHLGVSAANIVLGNGSDELIDIIIKAFVEEGQTILTSDVTFLEYEIVARILARRVITAPLKYFKYDLEAFKARIDKTTKVIFISNPNNPTGTYVTKQDFDNFILGLRQDLLVVLDEAYDAFIDVDDFPSGIKYLDKNVIVLKTFSKAYGLAGLRIGYAVADAGLASCMEKARQPFNTNSLAQSAATAALDDREFLRRSRRVILEGKAYLYDKLKVMAIPYVPSAANFILIDVGRDGAAVFREMLKFGVIVRDMKQYGLKNFIRVSVGTKKENQRFIRVLRKVIA
jgi:histidinol-phosphate aminotransferase